MDPDEITRLVDKMKLSLTETEEQFLLDDSDIQIGKDRRSQCLVAKVFSPKAINREAFRQQMTRILQAEKRCIIEAMGNNSFIFEFHFQRDRKRALMDGPWNFSRNLIVFREPGEWKSSRSIAFVEMNIWVQFHNSPIECMHEDMIQKLGRMTGTIV